MLRKKNITLNKKKAEGNETLAQGDCIQIFFSDETFDKFAKNQDALLREYEALKKLEPRGLSIVYEDADMLAANKPANLLSQKASDNDVSANELILGYLIRKGELCLEDFRTFRPSVCNRLDRNTTGLLLAGKSLQGLQMLSEALKTRGIHKYYRAVVLGEVKQETHLKGWLVKNEHKNQVRISQEACEDGEYIETSFVPIHGTKEYTMLEILLITGKSHQIRAHLSSIGHPIIGDPKYGDAKRNEYYKQTFGIRGQLLHAYRVEFPERTIEAPLPKTFQHFI